MQELDASEIRAELLQQIQDATQTLAARRADRRGWEQRREAAWDAYLRNRLQTMEDVLRAEIRQSRTELVGPTGAALAREEIDGAASLLARCELRRRVEDGSLRRWWEQHYARESRAAGRYAPDPDAEMDLLKREYNLYYDGNGIFVR